MISAFFTNADDVGLKFADALADGVIVAMFLAACAWLMRYGERKAAREAIARQFVRIFGMKLEHGRLTRLGPESTQGWLIVQRLEAAINLNRVGLSHGDFIALQEFIDRLYRGIGYGRDVEMHKELGYDRGAAMLKEFSVGLFLKLVRRLVPGKHRQALFDHADTIGFEMLSQSAAHARSANHQP